MPNRRKEIREYRKRLIVIYGLLLLALLIFKNEWANNHPVTITLILRFLFLLTK